MLFSFFLPGIITVSSGFSRNDKRTLSPSISLFPLKEPVKNDLNNRSTIQYLTFIVPAGSKTSEIPD